MNGEYTFEFQIVTFLFSIPCIIHASPLSTYTQLGLFLALRKDMGTIFDWQPHETTKFHFCVALHIGRDSVSEVYCLNISLLRNQSNDKVVIFLGHTRHDALLDS